MLLGENATKAHKLTFLSSEDGIGQIQQQAQDSLGDVVTITSSLPGMLEAMPKVCTPDTLLCGFIGAAADPCSLRWPPSICAFQQTGLSADPGTAELHHTSKLAVLLVTVAIAMFASQMHDAVLAADRMGVATCRALTRQQVSKSCCHTCSWKAAR